MIDDPPLSREEELYESWLNGNRKWVVEQILAMEKREAILITASLVVLLEKAWERGNPEWEPGREVRIFQRLVAR